MGPARTAVVFRVGVEATAMNGHRQPQRGMRGSLHCGATAPSVEMTSPARTAGVFRVEAREALLGLREALRGGVDLAVGLIECGLVAAGVGARSRWAAAAIVAGGLGGDAVAFRVQDDEAA